MSYGFTPKQAAEYDRWKTTPPDDYFGPCDKCKRNSCDDCEYAEDYCKECKSTNCTCEKEEE